MLDNYETENVQSWKGARIDIYTNLMICKWSCIQEYHQVPTQSPDAFHEWHREYSAFKKEKSDRVIIHTLFKIKIKIK